MMKSKAFTKLREHMVVAVNSLKGVREGQNWESTVGKKRKAVLSPK